MTDTPPAPLTAAERAAIRARHRSCPEHGSDTCVCLWCGVDWPCDVIRSLATIDAAEQRGTDERERLESHCGAELAAERERRERSAAERDEISRHYVTCAMVDTERAADLRAERDAARAWSAAWKAAAHNHRQSAHRLIDEQVDVRLERITAERERDEARAQVAALREAVEYVVDGLEHQSLIDVEAANYLRAALGNAPAAHTCREPALREALDRIAGQRHVDCCPVETGDEARRIACAALGAAPEEPES